MIVNFAALNRIAVYQDAIVQNRLDWKSMSSPARKSSLSRWIAYYKSVKARVHVDKGFFKGAYSVAKIYSYFTGQRIRRAFQKNTNRKSIAFYPQPAGPWYNIWMTSQVLGLSITSDIDRADYIFVFDDFTQTDSGTTLSDANRRKAINHGIRDIGKSYIGEVFQSVFGYSIAVDPTKFEGQAVCKSEMNGTHDGFIVDCPIKRDEVIADHAYQRLIDATFNGKTSEDLRIACTFGAVAAVFHKHKALDERFGTTYLSTDVRDASEVFSAEELELISEFLGRMGLDYGAVDVMRDKHDGRIYIVDVNKTCMPVLSLTLKTQIDAQTRVAEAFKTGLDRIDRAALVFDN